MCRAVLCLHCFVELDHCLALFAFGLGKRFPLQADRHTPTVAASAERARVRTVAH